MKFISLLIISVWSSIASSSEMPEDVLLSIGRIISYEDTAERDQSIGLNPYSAEHHMKLIESEFENVRNSYGVETQVDFLWVVMSRSSFGSEYSERFSELVFGCCEVEFQNAIEQYLASGTKKNRAVEHKAKFIQSALRLHRDHHNNALQADG